MFLLLIIPSFALCCILGSWTTDPNGNIIGENKFDINIVDNYGWTKQQNSIFIIPNGTVAPLTNTTFTPNTQYTISFNFELQGNYGQSNLRLRLTYTDNTYVDIPSTTMTQYETNTIYNFVYTSTENKTISVLRAHFGSSNYDCSLKIYYLMINEGTKAKPWEPAGVYYSSQNYYNLQETYEQALQGTSIDYNNYTIQLVSYPTSDTTSNYSVVQTLTTRDYVNEQGFLNIYEIIQLNGFGDTWDGIVVTSTQYLNTYNYNLLFNGSGNSNLDFAIYYKYYESEKFRKISLMNIVGDSAYYGYFDLINLFGKNAINENIQDILYNKFAIHWTNNPTPNDLINIKLNSTDGFNMGYAKGVQDNLINLEELNETIEEQTKQLQEKQKQYDALLDHYNNAQLDNPLSSMVVAIADIPLNLFHNMFNFDIMGFNLAAFILGIITILLVAYVIKLFL